MQLANVITAKLKNPTHKQEIMVITGTPQIGKSTFLSYMLGLIPKTTPYKKICVLAQRRNKQDRTPKYTASFVSFNDGNAPTNGQPFAKVVKFVMFTEDMIQALASDAKENNAVALLDGFAEAPEFLDYFGHMIVFSSQGFNYSWSANRSVGRLPGSQLMFMPVWTPEEIGNFKTKSQDEDKVSFPAAYSVTDLYSLFGGCIGYMLAKDFEDEKLGLLNLTIQDHVNKFRDEAVGNCLNFDAKKATAALIKIIPTKELRAIEQRDWISQTVHDAVLNEMRLADSDNARDHAASSEGAVGGYFFEQAFGKEWQRGGKATIYMYKSFATNKKWYDESPEMVDLKLARVTRNIKFRGDDFPTGLDVLHRLDKFAPSIDYYHVSKVEEDAATSGGPSYILRLLQITVGEEHTVDPPKVGKFLQTMDHQINVQNGKRREEIKAGNTATRQKFKYLEQDDENELDVGLHSPNVKIEYVYLQKNLSKSFRGDKVTEENACTQMELKKKPALLYKKVKTVYAYQCSDRY